MKVCLLQCADIGLISVSADNLRPHIAVLFGGTTRLSWASWETITRSANCTGDSCISIDSSLTKGQRCAGPTPLKLLRLENLSKQF